MKTFLAPNGVYINVPDGRVTTIGLSDEQNQLVRNAFPTKDYELLDTDTPSDLIAIHATSLIINASELDEEGRNLIFDYYTEVGGKTAETVFWIGYPKPLNHLRAFFKCHEDFDQFAFNLKYHLLSAHRKSKKAMNFSKKLADCIEILSLIRTYPGIKTKELVDKLELPTRTVQRYISTLQMAGEWIEYDTRAKGWRLQNGISIFFGDHLKDTDEFVEQQINEIGGLSDER